MSMARLFSVCLLLRGDDHDSDIWRNVCIYAPHYLFFLFFLLCFLAFFTLAIGIRLLSTWRYILPSIPLSIRLVFGMDSENDMSMNVVGMILPRTFGGLWALLLCNESEETRTLAFGRHQFRHA